MALPSKVCEDFFQKEASHQRGQKFFGQKKYGEAVLNWRTNDHIMSMLGGVS